MKKVTRQEQYEMGLLRNPPIPNNFVPSRRNSDLTDVERGVLSSAVASAGDMISSRQQTHHARSDDSAMTLAMASLLYAAGLAIPAALITGGLLLIAYMLIGHGDAGIWSMSFMVLWGISILAAMLWNRKIGLWHSPTGLAHHEIDSRERVALHAIDRHADIIEKRLGMDDSDVVDVTPDRRRLQ